MSILNTPNHDDVRASELHHQAAQGASWFYWIAALSAITSIIAFTGGQWGFAIALGFTQIADAIAEQLARELDLGSGPRLVALVFDLIAAGVFAIFGALAQRRQNWAYLLGIILYALDGALFLLAQDWIGLAFHAFALFFMIRGLRAGMQLAKLPAATATAEPAPAGDPGA